MGPMTRIQPLDLLFLLIIAVGLFRMRKCRGVLLPALGLLGLFLLSWPPMDWVLSRPLEAWYRLQPLPAAPADAIVVLSVGVNPPQYERPYSLPDKETYERCEFAAWLHSHWRPLPVLACGGPGAAREQPFSATMRRLLERDGVPESMIWTEERSRSTYENAANGAEILRLHGIRRIVLVTDARDMLRAERCFRKQGLVVVPAPCAFRQFGPLPEELMPTWKANYRNERTFHETVGLAWYWLRGWI
jgi:uncharacterized SAM-binding protein YcdF (DUF218 family)